MESKQELSARIGRAQSRRLPPVPKVPLVEVTQEIIATSVRKDSSHCMISDAIAAAVPDAKFISVDIQTIRYTLGEFRYTYLTPRRGQVALIRFDQGEEIEPFTFQLRTGQTTRSGARRAVRTGTPQPRTKAQQAATKNAMAQSTKPFGPREEAELVRGSGAQTNVPSIRGGHTPPLAPLANGPAIPKARRRTYGLRAMES